MDEISKEDMGNLFYRFSPGMEILIGTNITLKCTLVKNKDGEIRKILKITAPKSVIVKKVFREKYRDAEV